METKETTVQANEEQTSAWNADQQSKTPGKQSRPEFFKKHFSRNQNNSHEFLPAALEIQDTPPSPVGRLIIWSIMVFFSIAVVWAMVGKVDIVATAQGKIIPSGHVKVIQPLEIGVVRNIHVQEGQTVNAGDVLIELDPTQTGADKDNLNQELAIARLELKRLQILKRYYGDTTTYSVAPEAITASYFEQVRQAQIGSRKEAELQRDILGRQIAEHSARLGGLDKEVTRREAELASIHDQVTKLESTLPLITQRVDSLKTLAERQLISEHQFLELEEERITQQQDLASSRNRIDEITAAIDEIDMRKLATNAEYIKTLLSQQQEADRKVQAIEKELTKANQRYTLQKLTAPVDGVIQQLAIHTIGGVVTPAQQLMLIVPKEHSLEVEAFIANRDIGFVRDGQIAEVKIETFPFTKYGTIDAEIVHISNDAIPDENLGLVYAAKVLMAKADIQVEEKLVNLTPGMAVTVEVKIGTRRLIEFIMSPLLRYKDESMRER